MINREELKKVVKEAVEEVLFEKGLIRYQHEDLIDVAAASKLLNLARATIYEKTSLKILPHYKRGKKIMFKVSELLEWFEKGKVLTGDEVKMKTIEYLQRWDNKPRRGDR